MKGSAEQVAEESQQRATEIEGIVGNVRETTAEAVESLEETNEVVQEGAEKVRSSGETFKNIAEVVEEAESIAAANEEQTTKIHTAGYNSLENFGTP